MIKFMVDSGSDYDVNEAKEKGIVDQVIGIDCKLDDII